MKKGSKSAKTVTKKPFEKRESHMAIRLIAALTVFNLVYSYAIGLPLPRAVVAEYVESVYELGDLQVQGYQAMGTAIVALASMDGSSQQAALVESDVEFTYAEPDQEPVETNLVIAPY